MPRRAATAAERDVQLAVGAHDLEFAVFIELRVDRVQKGGLQAKYFYLL